MKPRYAVIVLALTVAAVACLVPAVSPATTPGKPNILFILTDPQEQVNLINDPQYAQTVARLRVRLKDWLAGFDRPFGEFVP